MKGDTEAGYRGRSLSRINIEEGIAAERERLKSRCDPADIETTGEYWDDFRKDFGTHAYVMERYLQS